MKRLTATLILGAALLASPPEPATAKDGNIGFGRTDGRAGTYFDLNLPSWTFCRINFDRLA